MYKNELTIKYQPIQQMLWYMLWWSNKNWIMIDYQYYRLIR